MHNSQEFVFSKKPLEIPDAVGRYFKGSYPDKIDIVIEKPKKIESGETDEVKLEI